MTSVGMVNGICKKYTFVHYIFNIYYYFYVYLFINYNLYLYFCKLKCFSARLFYYISACVHPNHPSSNVSLDSLFRSNKLGDIVCTV